MSAVVTSSAGVHLDPFTKSCADTKVLAVGLESKVMC